MNGPARIRTGDLPRSQKNFAFLDEKRSFSSQADVIATRPQVLLCLCLCGLFIKILEKIKCGGTVLG